MQNGENTNKPAVAQDRSFLHRQSLQLAQQVLQLQQENKKLMKERLLGQTPQPPSSTNRKINILLEDVTGMLHTIDQEKMSQ